MCSLCTTLTRRPVSADVSAYSLGVVLQQKNSDQQWNQFHTHQGHSLKQKHNMTRLKKALATTGLQMLHQLRHGEKHQMETNHKTLVQLLSTKQLNAVPQNISAFAYVWWDLHTPVMQLAKSCLYTHLMPSPGPIAIQPQQWATYSQQGKSLSATYCQPVLIVQS